MEIFFIGLIVLVFYGISFYLKKIVLPKIKGAYGEYKVSSVLNRLKRKEYLVLNDVLLKYGNSTTQIDHIVICKNGIFVIETKNYKGWIHGHQNSQYWTQTIYQHKNKLRNPIKQNWIHVYALKELLSEYGYINYFPIVVFTGSGKLKNITSTLPVIYTNRLLRTIKNLNKNEILSYEQMDSISKKLDQQRIIDRNQNRYHVKNVKKQIRERKKKVKSMTCPNCGNPLIRRKGKYGEFYGCQNFPICKYTININ